MMVARRLVFIFQLVCGILAGGCVVGQKPISRDDLLGQHRVLIVPLRGVSCILVSHDSGEAAFAVSVSPLPLLIKDAATKNERTQLAAMLNEAVANWSPEQVLAEECRDILREQAPGMITDITVANARPYPGTEAMRAPEAGIFVAEEPIRLQIAILKDWEGDCPPSRYAQEVTQAHADWVVEVTFVLMVLSRGDSLCLHTLIRLVDPASGRRVAASRWAYAGPLTPVGNKIDVAVFKEEFRKSVNTGCRNTLRAMALIDSGAGEPARPDNPPK
jgi:hypothetical protein